MLTVVCLKWGAKYQAIYPNRLRSMVARHLSQPHEFLCLTDDTAGVECETRPLDADLQGWWQKITLFRPNPYGIRGRMLFLDLDVVITGSLDELVDYLPGEPLVICRDFMKVGYNSSVFLLEAGSLPHVWERFTPAVTAKLHGDQDWITREVENAPVFPEGWCVSYRLQAQERVPETAKIVCFHGSPKPARCAGWVAENWR